MRSLGCGSMAAAFPDNELQKSGSYAPAVQMAMPARWQVKARTKVQAEVKVEVKVEIEETG